MALTTQRKRKNNHTQLCFSFLDAVPKPVTLAKRKTTPQPVRVRVPQPKQPPTNINNPFVDLCLVLHQLATKHVSRVNFADVNELLGCTKLMRQLGLAADAPADLQAPLETHDRALVTHAPQYRLLRSRAIAGLATVADLTFKAPAKGSAEYQKGQRDAYQQASEIAALFLDDISAGV